MENNLFISILICCYNSEKYISDTLDSVLIQNSNYETIIVDDGSEDNTKNIIEKKLIIKNIFINFKK